MEIKKSKYFYSIGLLSILGGSILATDVSASDLIIKQVGAITSAAAPDTKNLDDSSIDYKNAKPMPLPVAPVAPSLNPQTNPNAVAAPTMPGSSPGGLGNGKESPISVPKSDSLNQEDGKTPQGSATIVPQAFGTLSHPFTTARVANVLKATTKGLTLDKTYKSYPYRAAGRLFFNIGADTFVCSAALVKPGVIATAAHCVADPVSHTFYSNWVFIPAYFNGKGSYGKWFGVVAGVLTSYIDGTDPCVSGVVCQDDVAALVVSNAKITKFPGAKTGWFGYGWDGFGFTTGFPAFPNGLTHISQLGYPVALDFGEQMERNDSVGYKDTSLQNNTIIGSLMTGGSSGGPWVVNLGIQPSVSGIGYGSAASPNIIVGTTSWGYTDSTLKEQGASPFTSGNIAILVPGMCSTVPAAC